MKASLFSPHFRGDLPSKAEIFEYWKGRLRGLGCRINWDEPGCWACGFRYGTRYDIKWSDARWDRVLRCWNNIPLQRCHVVPRSLGGTNDVSNLFLMCRECHDLALTRAFLRYSLNGRVLKAGMLLSLPSSARQLMLSESVARLCRILAK